MGRGLAPPYTALKPVYASSGGYSSWTREKDGMKSAEKVTFTEVGGSVCWVIGGACNQIKILEFSVDFPIGEFLF